MPTRNQSAYAIDALRLNSADATQDTSPRSPFRTRSSRAVVPVLFSRRSSHVAAAGGHSDSRPVSPSSSAHAYSFPLLCSEGGATMYPPSPRVSTFLQMLPVEFWTTCPSSSSNRRCRPPPPVFDIAVRGKGEPASRSHSSISTSTGMSFASRSSTARREACPVRMPTFALGHFFHQLRIVGGSVVASCRPFFVNGSFFDFPDPTGKTCQPREAYRRAASRHLVSLIVSSQ